MRGRQILLVVLAVAEVLTLAALLVNLATAHDPAVTRIIGPVHGAAYLVVAATALLAPGLRLRTRLLGLLPVVGGVAAAWDAGAGARGAAAPRAPRDT